MTEALNYAKKWFGENNGINGQAIGVVQSVRGQNGYAKTFVGHVDQAGTPYFVVAELNRETNVAKGDNDFVSLNMGATVLNTNKNNEEYKTSPMVESVTVKDTNGMITHYYNSEFKDGPRWMSDQEITEGYERGIETLKNYEETFEIKI